MVNKKITTADCHIPVNSPVGTRVRVFTKWGGCFNSKTGAITARLSGNLELVQNEDPPYYYRVRLDSAANNGGEPVRETIFTPNELFQEGYTGGYWGHSLKA